jgi:hypothetical protein
MPPIKEVIADIYDRYRDMGGSDKSLLARAIQEDARSSDVLVDVLFIPEDAQNGERVAVLRRMLTPAEAVATLDALTDDESARSAGELVLMWSVPEEVQDAYQRHLERNLEDWAVIEDIGG